MINKKAEWGWEEISKIIVVLFVLVILIFLAFTFKDKLLQLIDRIKDFLIACKVILKKTRERIIEKS